MSDAQQPSSTPPGWYPHPTMPGTQAYWDGDRWTDHVAPAAGVPARADATQSAAKLFMLLVAVGVVVLMIVVAGSLVR